MDNNLYHTVKLNRFYFTVVVLKVVADILKLIISYISCNTFLVLGHKPEKAITSATVSYGQAAGKKGDKQKVAIGS